MSAEVQLASIAGDPAKISKRTLNACAQFFGIKGFGFTKENELFVGRVAQLGFAAALIGEAVTGVGPLAQLGEPPDRLQSLETPCLQSTRAGCVVCMACMGSDTWCLARRKYLPRIPTMYGLHTVSLNGGTQLVRTSNLHPTNPDPDVLQQLGGPDSRAPPFRFWYGTHGAVARRDG